MGASQTFDIYFVDTEGGHSTLYVSPSGQALLEDTGNRDGRDVDRIMAAIHAAGLTKTIFSCSRIAMSIT